MSDLEREKFEKWVTDMEPAYAASNLERLTGGRGGYRVHNVAIWWMAWLARSEAGSPAPVPTAKRFGATSFDTGTTPRDSDHWGEG